mgnify:CR=1 FL=1
MVPSARLAGPTTILVMNAHATTAVLLIAHGSRHQPANQDLFDLAARLEAVGEAPIVEACFLELAPPDIPSGASRCVERGASRILMVPYFLGMGVHLVRDLNEARRLLSESYPQVRFLLGPSLGPHPLLDELVICRVRQLDRDPQVALTVADGLTASFARLDGQH